MYGIITKDYILSKVSQQEIFELFLGVTVVPGQKYCSPLRKDNNPTCEFRLTNGKLYFVDYSGDFRGDCFDAVQRLYGVGYTRALKIVSRKFGLSNLEISEKRQPKITIKQEQFKSYKEIEIMVREWEKDDLTYWGKFEINLQTLQAFQVFPIQYAFLDGRVVYGYSSLDPAYAYRFGNKKYKIYFPFRSHSDIRFMSNTTKIQGLNQLPEKGKLLILTKSLKDVMVLRRFGIHSIAFQSESIVPKQNEIQPFLDNWEQVFSFYDFDRAGVRSANKMRKLYGIQPIFLTDGKLNTYNYGAKDPAEYVEKNGKNKAFKLIKLWKSSL